MVIRIVASQLLPQYMCYRQLHHSTTCRRRRGWNVLWWNVLCECVAVARYTHTLPFSLRGLIVFNISPHIPSHSTQRCVRPSSAVAKKKKKVDTFHTHGSSSCSSREWWKTFSLCSYAVLKTILLRVKISKSVQSIKYNSKVIIQIFTNHAKVNKNNIVKAVARNIQKEKKNSQKIITMKRYKIQLIEVVWSERPLLVKLLTYISIYNIYPTILKFSWTFFPYF